MSAIRNDFREKVAGTEPPAIWDPWSASCPDPLAGTVKPPRGWENEPGGWKTHYRVSQPVRVQRGLVEAIRREISPERWAMLMAEWDAPVGGGVG